MPSGGWEPSGGIVLSSSHGSASLLQEIAQINEDNLTAYNRCALFALGAAYLNLISQLTTVPTFCQHIHEVRGRVWGQGWSLVRGSSGIDSPGHLWGLSLAPCLSSTGHPDAAEGSSLSAP